MEKVVLISIPTKEDTVFIWKECLDNPWLGGGRGLKGKSHILCPGCYCRAEVRVTSCGTG